MRRISHSSASLFQKCPAAWNYQYNLGVRGPSGKAAERGSRLHAACEKWLMGHIDKLPIEFWKIQGAMGELRRTRPQVEVEVAVDAEWRACDPLSKDAAWLSIIDILARPGPTTIHLVDLKSGKPYSTHQDQLQLYATMMLSITDALDVGVSALYIDDGGYGHEKIYPRSLLPMLKSYYDDLRRKIHEEKEFAPTPSFDACRFCAAAAQRGGPCTKAFGGEGK